MGEYPGLTKGDRTVPEYPTDGNLKKRVSRRENRQQKQRRLNQV